MHIHSYVREDRKEPSSVCFFCLIHGFIVLSYMPAQLFVFQAEIPTQENYSISLDILSSTSPRSLVLLYPFKMGDVLKS